MNYCREIYIPTARQILAVYPEARVALEELIPELRNKKTTVVVTGASFAGKDIGGSSKEARLTAELFHDYITGKPREFTKITFEWEE
jgi:hypothetical protein